jgi:NitT/TauT family transport system permease protein
MPATSGIPISPTFRFSLFLSTAATPRGGLPEVRPEILREPEPFVAMPLARALPWPQRLWQHGWLRKAAILLVLAILWELAARVQDNDLLLPSFLATARAFAADMANGELPGKAAASLSVLLRGYACGVALAFVLTRSAGPSPGAR